ncbi:MAG: PhoH family protein, partial [Muribaculaceae bacterium]|nr:PhoH family protein [Muribaculaceae bacterium]
RWVSETEIDLPRTTQSGLMQALKILRGVKGIGIIEYQKKDIVRHPLVQRIVDAYEAREQEVDREFEDKIMNKNNEK